MFDPPPLLSPAGPHFPPRGRLPQLRSTSDSPTRQRPTDDLLSNLSPRLAVDAFRNPSGALKTAMDAATPSEQAFAMRAAVASRNIQEWLDELSEWPWPAEGGAAGFEMPSAKRRKVSRSEGPVVPEDYEDDRASMQKGYCGSLMVEEVGRYERRLEEISQEMEELDVEEIKTHVLHNHILPLSRPGSPMSESNRSVMSLATYVRMDDFTALITATIIQTLPNLSRLARLMNAWSVRLLVLRKVPTFLEALGEADGAIQTAWSTINIRPGQGSRSQPSNGGGQEESFKLTREEIDVMKSVLGRLVSRAGRYLDLMLDALEGRLDTLPEAWIDSMDALEKDYAEWVAVCERQLEWAHVGIRRVATENGEGQRGENGHADVKEAPSATSLSLNTEVPAPTIPITSTSRPKFSDIDTPVIKIHSAVEETGGDGNVETQPAPDTFDGSEDEQWTLVDTPGRPGCGDDDEQNVDNDAVGDRSVSGLDGQGQQSLMFDSDFEIPSDSEEPPMELPVLPPPSRGSDISETSTVVHGLQGSFPEFSSDGLEHGTPELPRLREVDVDKSTAVDDTSPPSSPPVPFRSSTRSLSVSFNEMPTVAELPEIPVTPIADSSMLNTSMLDSMFTDDIRKDPESPSKMSTFSNADDHLQHQISEILETLPAKIRLTSEPQPINLNPPDFQMPSQARPSKPDPFPRSQSSLSTRSSRAGTPSFLLAPAYPRSRSRQNRDIKLYHLSRSNGEAPIKLFIRCVGEHGERVMVRVGGGWADLGEYLKEYASHHGRRSGKDGKVEIRDLPVVPPRLATAGPGSSPPSASRPASAMDFRGSTNSPITPLNVRKTRKNIFDDASGSGSGSGSGPGVGGSSKRPGTPLANSTKPDTPSSGASGVSTRSRSSSRLSWTEEDSSLGMAGPRAKNIEMSEESRAWVESVKEKVRVASGERIAKGAVGANAGAASSALKEITGGDASVVEGKFGELGKVGGTKRLFRRQG